jgi:hypothetical protein
VSGGELAVVLASVAVVVAVAVLGAIGVTLNRSLRDLRRLLSVIRRDLLPAVQRIEEASGQVTGEVQRVGGLLDVAERVSERAETLSQVTTRALLEPLAAVASLFRRGSPSRPAAVAAAEPGAPAAPRPPRRTPWARRMTAYLLRSGYRSASARIAARMATAPSQRSAATGIRGGRRGGRRSASTGVGHTGPGAGPGSELLDAVREVSREISAAMEEGRAALRGVREGDGRPE